MPRRLWLLLHEPRIITAATGLSWLIITGIGVAALISPPGTISHELGSVLTVVWGASLLVGGILGLIGCLPGWWWVERAGIIAASTGALMYLAVVMVLHFIEPGSRLVQAGFILLALASLVVRWLRIAGPQVDPTRRAGTRVH